MMINDKAENTRINVLNAIMKLSESLGDTNFENTTKDDIINYLEKLKLKEKSGKLKSSTINMTIVKVRSFYKWVNGGKDYPECVAWLKPKRSMTVLSPDSIYAEDEIKRLINYADNDRDRAIVAVLYETGCRIGEFLSMKINDAAKGLLITRPSDKVALLIPVPANNASSAERTVT